tara:strand:+ start:81556 stop:81759 length:204 start_codon:yes stop_codon:yes gene_type:complete
MFQGSNLHISVLQAMKCAIWLPLIFFLKKDIRHGFAIYLRIYHHSIQNTGTAINKIQIMQIIAQSLK